MLTKNTTEMTYFEKAINLIQLEGYGIGIEQYTNGIINYSLMKKLSKSERLIHFDCSRNVALMLMKRGAKIIYRRNGIKALNFTPEKLPHNCIRHYTE